MSQAGKYISAAALGAVDSITGNVGGAVGPDGAGNIDFTGSTGQILITGNPGANSLVASFTTESQKTAINGWNGAIIETAAVTVTSDGATITFSVEQSGGGDLTVVFSDGFYAWDTTPADTITLTAGSDTSPQINYVYFLQSTKALTVSTSSFPSAEHAPLATVLCQSAASLQTDGAYKVHAWTDHITDTNDQGHLSHLNAWIREQNATWMSGVAPTLTITPNGGVPDNVIFTNASGSVLQLHPHVFPAFGGTPDVYTVNDSVTPYNIVTDLNALLTDSTGASMSGRFFTLVIWGVVSEDTADCKLMVNLPGGSYSTQAALEADPDRYANFSIPTNFKGVGFLIYQMNLRHQVASGGTWTSISEFDLRGLFPSTAAGGSTSFATEFEDNTFRILDDGDNTKELAFEVSPVTTATTRTITMDDRDIDMDAVPDSFPTDSGTGTPAGGVLTIAGGVGVSTSASGSTITISAPDSGVMWTEVTGTSQSLAVNNGYILNNAALVTATLPASAAVGDVIIIVGKGAGLWKIAQNAGQTIHFISSDTTTGAGGSLSATVRYDCVELVCTTANTDFVVRSSVGNITVV
jgi:hypothetical protein